MNWFLIIRPNTLTASACPVAIALCAAASEGLFRPATALLTLVSALGIQILSNLFNDYYDYKKGADGEGRTGPKRAITEGWVTPRQMMQAIVVVGLIAVASGAWLVYEGGVPILIVGASGLLFAWLYTATRFSLSYLGIADLFVLVYFGPVATVGTYYLQTDSYSPHMLAAGVACGLLSMSILTANNLRDFDQDRRNRKKTIIVRIGVPRGQILYTLLLLIPIAIATAVVSFSALALLLGVGAIVLSIRPQTPEVHQRALILTTIFLLLFSAFWIVAS